MSKRQPPLAVKPWLAQSEFSVQPQAEQARPTLGAIAPPNIPSATACLKNRMIFLVFKMNLGDDFRVPRSRLRAIAVSLQQQVSPGMA